MSPLVQLIYLAESSGCTSRSLFNFVFVCLCKATGFSPLKKAIGTLDFNNKILIKTYTNRLSYFESGIWQIHLMWFDA